MKRIRKKLQRLLRICMISIRCYGDAESGLLYCECCESDSLNQILTSFFYSCLQKHSKVDDAKLKKTREDLQSRVDFLKKQADVSLENFLYFFMFTVFAVFFFESLL